MHRLLSIGSLGLLSLLACKAKVDDTPPPALAEAVALEGKGDLPGAAAKYELVCAQAPGSSQCTDATTKAANAWMSASDAAMKGGDYAKARAYLERAAESPNADAKKKATDALAGAPLVDGLRWGRAKSLAAVDPRGARAEVEAIAALSSSVAADARAWLKTERPKLLLADVRLACAKDGEGSCTRAYHTLKDLAADAPELADGQKLYDQEQRRIYKYYGAIEQRLTDAKDAHDALANDDSCKGPAGCDPTSPPSGKAKLLALEFERLVRDLGDDEITKDAQARWSDAINAGVYKWKNPPAAPAPEVAKK